MTAAKFLDGVLGGVGNLNGRHSGRVLYCDEDNNVGMIHGSDDVYYRFVLDDALCVNPGDIVDFDGVISKKSRDCNYAFSVVKHQNTNIA